MSRNYYTKNTSDDQTVSIDICSARGQDHILLKSVVKEFVLW